ncbi:MAG: hypothetical protein ACI8RZ_004482 [Myxococcota bacterium]
MEDGLPLKRICGEDGGSLIYQAVGEEFVFPSAEKGTSRAGYHPVWWLVL